MFDMKLSATSGVGWIPYGAASLHIIAFVLICVVFACIKKLAFETKPT